MNKLLILSKKREEWQELEKVFREVVSNGGELFFVEKEESALSILEHEKPHLILMDGLFFDGKENLWEEKKIPMVVIRDQDEKKGKEKESIFRPLKDTKVLEVVAPFLSKEKEKEPVPL